MHRTFRAMVSAALAVGTIATLVGTAGAGLNPIITGVATCNTTTGQYDIVWTLTDIVGIPPFQITNPGVVTETPGGATSNVTFSPTTVPTSGTSTAAGPVSGTTTSAAIDVVAAGAPRHFEIDSSDGLLGTCAVASGGGGDAPSGGGSTPSPTPVEATPQTVG